MPLAEVAQVNPRLTQVLNDDDTVSFLGMADVSEGGTTTAGGNRTYGEVRKGFTPFENGDILLAKITPCFQNGKIAQAAVTHPNGYGSTEFHAIRPGDGLDHRYLLHYLRQDYIRIDGERRMTGSGGQRRVPADFVKQLPIPMPPLAEQRRIAAILDHADALRAKRREALARLDELGDAIYLSMFESPDYQPERVRLDEVSVIASGITKGRKVKDAAMREVPYLAVVNVQDKRLDLSTVKTIEVTAVELDRWRIQRDDLLLTEGGDPDKLGRGCLWNEELSEAIHQNHVFRVRPDRGRVNPVYLNWAVGSRRGKAYFMRSAKQTTGIASINMTQLKAFPLDLPSMDVQEAFAARIRQLDLVKAQHHATLTELDALFASLQSRAFRGEL